MKRLLSLLRPAQDERARRRARSEPTDLFFGRLPPLLVREAVIPFLAAPPELLSLQEQGFSLRAYKQALLPLRRVSRQWLALVRELQQDARGKVICLVFHCGDGGEFHREQRRATRKGATLQQLQIVTGVALDGWDEGFVLKNYRSLRPTGLSRQSWGLVFSELPKLVRLDLSTMAADLLGEVLQQSSTSCPNVQALVLPFNQDAVAPKLPDLVSQISTALERWFLSNGGLKMFWIPWIPEDQRTELSDIIAAVATFCPQIEQFCGWHLDMRNGPFDRSHPVEESVWIQFCNTCTRLQTFEWCLVKLSKRSIEQFCATERPQLIALSIVDQGAEFDVDFDSLEVLQPIFSVSPNLRIFEFMQSESPNDAWSDREGVPADRLCEYVSQNCRFLEEMIFYTYSQLDPSPVLTERGAIELIKLPFMQKLALYSIQLERNGLVKLLEVAASDSRTRPLYLTMQANTPCHSQIVPLLEHLETREPFQRRVHLVFEQMRLRNVSYELEPHLRTPNYSLLQLISKLDKRSKNLRLDAKVKATRHGDVFQLREVRVRFNHDGSGTSDDSEYGVKLVVPEPGMLRESVRAQREAQQVSE